MREKLCRICGIELRSEHEVFTGVCYECRHYGLINGKWPKKKSSKNSETNAEE